jgi:dTMP kinase
MNDVRGLFVALDGPKHSGKTTVLDQLVAPLQAAGLRVLRTKEPTAAFDLANEQTHHGLDLARLVCEDRAQHLATTIEPALADHNIVITDRYIGSSLVFQVLDGVPFTEVWNLNQHFPLPDINFIVTADEDTLARRQQQRERVTRFDRQHHFAREREQYETVAAFLREQGVHTAVITNDDTRPPVSTAAGMTATILNHLRHRR